MGAGRYMAAGASSLSSLILIDTLHKRSRWYNMLRIFKTTSPMSMGIWAITSFTGLAAAGRVLEEAGVEKAGRLLGRIGGVPACVLAMITISYMGTELEEMNLPVWAGAHPLLAPFMRLREC
ncbi:MAG: hypothetical protein ACP5SH_03675 [Syntrophobacteraceae bacterium]